MGLRFWKEVRGYNFTWNSFCFHKAFTTWKQTYIYIPGTQMTLVLIGKDLVLEGSTTKIEDKQVAGIYIYILCMNYT